MTINYTIDDQLLIYILDINQEVINPVILDQIKEINWNLRHKHSNLMVFNQKITDTITYN